MKGSKIIGVSLGFLVGLIVLGGLACAFAWLIMLVWNIVGIAALSIAVPLTFLTALKGVGILYVMLGLASIIRVIIQSFTQKIQIQATLKMMRKFDEEMKDTQAQKGEGDFLKHFRMS